MTVRNEQLKAFEKRLRTEESFLLQEIQSQVAELSESMEAAGEERVSAPEDAGAEVFEHEKTMAVEGAFEQMLAEVRHALHKIASGTYGLCDACGQAINPMRLEARPQASLCVACKTSEEHAHHGQRPLIVHSS
jgi:RNA polymerase-binding transcription factor